MEKLTQKAAAFLDFPLSFLPQLFCFLAKKAEGKTENRAQEKLQLFWSAFPSAFPSAFRLRLRGKSCRKADGKSYSFSDFPFSFFHQLFLIFTLLGGKADGKAEGKR